MLAAYAVSQSSSDPLSGLVIGQRPDPVARPGWSVVKLRAMGLNHHDVWSLLGVGLPADRLPMILGCDGSGVDEAGNEAWPSGPLSPHLRAPRTRSKRCAPNTPSGVPCCSTP